MFTRIRAAFAVALLFALVATFNASAKGGFAFLSITGPSLKEERRVSDPKLTADFFTFADFSRDQTKTPADPGEGYEVTRYYIDGKTEVAFDQLHYYPETGFVYYDGIVNGESEYDGEWYTANPEIKTIFESTLGIQTGTIPAAEKEQSAPSAPQPQPESAKASAQPIAARLPSFPIITAIAAGLIALFAFAFWRRKSAQQ